MSRIAFTHHAGGVTKRILLVLPFMLAACDSSLTEPRKNLFPTAGSLSADRGSNGQEADSKGKKRHTFNDTFTKWITTFPNMAGIVGGDVGAGTYAGEILNIGSVGTITNIEALYHFNGKDHSFTAHVFITEDDAAGNAVITGRVTKGWLEGARVTGQYTIRAECPIPTPGNSLGTLCFQGALQIVKGGRD